MDGFLCATAVGFFFDFFLDIRISLDAAVQQRKRFLIEVLGSGKRSDSLIGRAKRVELLKSKSLLAAALRDPKGASLSIFAGVRDQEEWLQDHLEVSFPEGGEVLAISLRGPAAKADDLRRKIPGIPVGLLTGYHNSPLVNAAKKAGAKLFTKPVIIQEVVDFLRAEIA